MTAVTRTLLFPEILQLLIVTGREAAETEAGAKPVPIKQYRAEESAVVSIVCAYIQSLIVQLYLSYEKKTSFRLKTSQSVSNFRVFLTENQPKRVFNFFNAFFSILET